MALYSDRRFTRSWSFWIFWVLCALVLAIHWRTMHSLWEVWTHNPQNSHGMIVPIAVGYLMWTRGVFGGVRTPYWSVWGLTALGGSMAMYAIAIVLGSFTLSAVALAGAVASLIVLMIGPAASRQVIGPIALLFLGIPVPEGIVAAITGPLQGVATTCSATTLELLGAPVVREGHTLLVWQSDVQVAGACDGLAMITGLAMVGLFVAMSGRRTNAVKVLIVLSVIPTALLVNIIRITSTVVAYDALNTRMGEAFVHSLAGWLMMPLALGITVGWLHLGSWLGIPALGKCREEGDDFAGAEYCGAITGAPSTV